MKSWNIAGRKNISSKEEIKNASVGCYTAVYSEKEKEESVYDGKLNDRTTKYLGGIKNEL